MLAPIRTTALGRALGATPATSLPGFLVPAFHAAPARHFSATTSQASKLGRAPIAIPPGVELTISEPWVKEDPTSYMKVLRRTVTIQGPLGLQKLDIEPFVQIDHDTVNGTATLSVQDKEQKRQREMWGTTWAYMSNYIRGVSEGHAAILRLVGIGYRATVDARPEKEEYPGQQFVCLKLGFSHPVEIGVPKGMKASAPQPTRVLLEGINKEELMNVADQIRRWRKPEPYKGKGIFINDQTIKLKQKKIK